LFSILKFLGVKVRKQVILDGPVSCGKSIALAMLVQWAREEGWLVFYVPRGKEWTHGGFFYKHPQTGLWDTPVQAENVLKVRLRVLLFLALPVLYHCMFCVFLCFKEDK
jgi:hypothetical protein